MHKKYLTKKECVSFLMALTLFTITSPVNAESSSSVSDEKQIGVKEFITDSKLDLKLHTEVRNADRGGVYGIDAWTQGIHFDYESGKALGIFGVEAGYHYIGKLLADPDKATHGYLQGTGSYDRYGHSSYDIATVAAVVDAKKMGEIKIGRFVADSSYDKSLVDIPLVYSSSNRMLPNISEGVLWNVNYGKNLKLSAIYSQKKIGGFNTNWVNLEETPEYALGFAWKKDKFDIKAGAKVAEEKNNQLTVKTGYGKALGNGAFVKLNTTAMYGMAEGNAKDTIESAGTPTDTYVLSASTTYTLGKNTWMLAAGKVGDKVAFAADIDTDIGHAIEMSIDRNKHQMFSWQVANFHNLTKNTMAGVAVVVTNGYDDVAETVKVNGVGANILLSHKFTEEPVKDLSVGLILNKAVETRTNQDNRDYYDVKFTVKKDINLLK